MTFKKQLLLIREGNGKTQREMAEILGITTMQYNRYENGAATPTFKMLQKIATKFQKIILIAPDNG